MDKFALFKHFSFSKSETGKYFVLVEKGEICIYDSLDDFIDFVVNYINNNL